MMKNLTNQFCWWNFSSRVFLQIKCYCLFIIFYLFAITSLNAGVFDDISVNARTAGIGDAFTGQADDISAVFYNPAGLAQMEKVNYCLSFRDFYNKGLLYQNFLSVLVPGEFLNAAFSLHRLCTDTEIMNYIEDTYIVSLSGTPRLLKHFYLGINLKIFRVYSEIDASGYGVDMGFLYRLRENLSVGALLKDVNNPKLFWESSAEDKIQKETKFGLSFAPFQNIYLSIDSEKYENRRKLNLGSEIWMLNKKFGLRGGIGLFEGLRKMSFGTTFVLGNLYLDYALVKDKNLGFTNFFTLRIYSEK